MDTAINTKKGDIQQGGNIQKVVPPSATVGHIVSSYYEEQKLQKIRMMAAIWAAGSLIGLLYTLSSSTTYLNRAGDTVGAAVGLATAVFVALSARKLSTWIIHLLLILSIVSISGGIFLDKGSSDSLAVAFMYIWVVLYIAYFFSLKQVLGYLGFVLFNYIVVLALTARTTMLPSAILIAGTLLECVIVVSYLNSKLKKMAVTDALTGLPNRQWLEMILSREIARAERQKSPLSVAIVDLDHFKFVNDTKGHAAGDELLVDIAERWKAALRTVDLMARYGGDEFVLVLPDCMLSDADKVLTRLQTSATQGCSAGVASWRKGDTAATILARADKALYKAKQDGRGRIENEMDGSPFQDACLSK